jgi:hypothetical protein
VQFAMPSLLDETRARAIDDLGPETFDDLFHAHELLRIIGWTPCVDGPETPVEIDDPVLRDFLRRIAHAAMAEGARPDGDEFLVEYGEALISALGWRYESSGGAGGRPTTRHPETGARSRPYGAPGPCRRPAHA